MTESQRIPWEPRPPGTLPWRQPPPAHPLCPDTARTALDTHRLTYGELGASARLPEMGKLRHGVRQCPAHIRSEQGSECRAGLIASALTGHHGPRRPGAAGSPRRVQLAGDAGVSHLRRVRRELVWSAHSLYQ